MGPPSLSLLSGNFQTSVLATSLPHLGWRAQTKVKSLVLPDLPFPERRQPPAEQGAILQMCFQPWGEGFPPPPPVYLETPIKR